MGEGAQHSRPDTEKDLRDSDCHLRVSGIRPCETEINYALPWRAEPGPLNGSYRQSGIFYPSIVMSLLVVTCPTLEQAPLGSAEPSVIRGEHADDCLWESEPKRGGEVPEVLRNAS